MSIDVGEAQVKACSPLDRIGEEVVVRRRPGMPSGLRRRAATEDELEAVGAIGHAAVGQNGVDQQLVGPCPGGRPTAQLSEAVSLEQERTARQGDRRTFGAGLEPSDPSPP